MDDLISVIVPIYMVEMYLDQCVSSIVSQTYKNLEIILVDDGSPDGCPDLCDKWAEKDNRIRVIHKLNGGLSDARNAGIKVASGDYIAFVDSDDWIDPNMYRLMMDVIKKENADICSCGIVVSECNGEKPLELQSFTGNSEEVLQMIYEDAAYPVAAWNKLYRRECWANFEFPVGKICEDAFTTYLLVERAQRIVQISNPLYYYRIRNSSIMTSSFNIKRMDEEEAWRVNYEYMERHYPHIYIKAYNFYLQKVNILIHAISTEEREKFIAEYNYLYKVLKCNFWYIVLKSKMKLKYRVKFAWDFLQL